jgi:hypothetical protein
MTKIFSLLFLLPFAHGWIESRMLRAFSYRGSMTSLSAEETKTAKTAADNPCWQDIYDEDCSMDNAYAASFVASEWLKRMPCGQGIEVRNASSGLVNSCSSVVSHIEILNV